ncbi:MULTISPECIES: peptidase inhibitor family I36 protein [Micromonospora]|uniref:Peptidase inhibitor family I36 protein n=1 Tax=Micromonospora antibiotica TaxID=2807623 RepID=A0ABS3VHE6_9ACTN|nr:peptidase inhibitor family I36 protein [Micromonospora antibiotica]MBO4165065.1 peptidase inhibitor family I36 protein [Micromonospora antibiotica]
MFNRLTAGLVVTVAVAATTVVVGSPAMAAGTCSSGHFCAFSGTSYNGTKVLDSTASSGSVDAGTHDVISSVINNTSKRWCGVNNGFPGDDTVLSVAQNTSLASLDARANDKIDHFYVISNGSSCS